MRSKTSLENQKSIVYNLTVNKKRADRVPKRGYRVDGSAVYRKGHEYLIVRPNRFGSEQIVTYGVNDD